MIEVPFYRSNKFGGTVLSIVKTFDAILQKEITLPDAEDYEDEEIAYKEPDKKNIAYVAVALFFGYIDVATTIAESHGGGGGDTSGWERDKKDDDEEWMRRCARRASQLCTPKHHPKLKRGGGFHR